MKALTPDQLDEINKTISTLNITASKMNETDDPCMKIFYMGQLTGVANTLQNAAISNMIDLEAKE